MRIPPSLDSNRERWLVGLIGLLLGLGTLVCYWPVRHFDFVNLDDPLYVYQNRIVQRGLSGPGVIWAFQSVAVGNWNPLVWLSHMADCQLYGITPGGHHVTNLLLHLANVWLLFLILKRLTGATWRSGLVAAIFAWHPLHVESVAWVSERKDVLSTLFWMLTLWAYVRYAEVQGPKAKVQSPSSQVGERVTSDAGRAASAPQPATRNSPHVSRFTFHALRAASPSFHYFLALVFFVLGLMSKPMLVTLPFVLLLLDYWPLCRLSFPLLHRSPTPPWRLLLEKLPFAVISLAACALAIGAQQGAGALGTEPLALRLENAAVSYATYLGKFLWPVNLAVFYPFPRSLPVWQAGGAALVLGAISWAVVRGTTQRRYLGVGWFWFLGTLVPVIGLVQVGMQRIADRYTYVPYIGLAVMVSWGLADLAAAWPRGRAALAGVAGLALAGWLGVACSQVEYWRDSKTLFEHALKATSGNYFAHTILGDLLKDKGKLDEAEKHYQEVVRLGPMVAEPYNDLGEVYALQNKLDQAKPLFSKAKTLDPRLAAAYFNLGSADLLEGKTAEAIAELKVGLGLKPGHMPAQKQLAGALLKLGRVAEALPYCQAVVAAEPDDALAHFNLGWAYLTEKQPEPAITNYRAALRLAPDAPGSMNGLAWVYATCPQAELRNGAQAVRLAERACQITKRQQPEMLDTLAAAYAEAGRFDAAVKTAEEVLARAAAAHDTNMVDTARQRLALYQTRKPYRDAP